jgi:hypothetical protein
MSLASLRRTRGLPRLTPFAVVALAAVGCQIASANTGGLPGEELIAHNLPAATVETLDLPGTGPVSWWTRSHDNAPHDELEVVLPFMPVTDVATTEVLHPDVTAADGERDPDVTAPAADEVVVRPGWTTRIDNRSAVGSRTTGMLGGVTVSFLNPLSPGAHPDDANLPVIDFSVSVEVAAGECVDVVALQAWQLGAPAVQADGEAVQADYLGTVVVRQPCE